MTWTQIGWSIIALAAILLAGFNLLIRHRYQYRARINPAVNRFQDQRVIAFERGVGRQVVIGEGLWTHAYPGLGLHALFTLPGMISHEDRAEGGQVVSAGSGVLVLFARQIVEGCYQDGFSPGLQDRELPVSLPGPTPLSFTAGLLPDLSLQSPGSLAMFGSFGLSAPLWAEAAQIKGGHVFAAAGSITAQAALFLNVRDLLIGEEIFMLPGLMRPTAPNQAGWLTEDILRVSLMALLIVAAILKMAGLL
jgi:hypothetical protein